MLRNLPRIINGSYSSFCIRHFKFNAVFKCIFVYPRIIVIMQVIIYTNFEGFYCFKLHIMLVMYCCDNYLKNNLENHLLLLLFRGFV